MVATSLTASFANSKNEAIVTHSLKIPAVAIECKTYLDKTMLESASASAEELKRINPNSRYFIAAEWLKLTESVNLRKYRIDQINRGYANNRHDNGKHKGWYKNGKAEEKEETHGRHGR